MRSVFLFCVGFLAGLIVRELDEHMARQRSENKEKDDSEGFSGKTNAK